MNQRQYAFVEWVSQVMKDTGKNKFTNGLELLTYMAEDLAVMQAKIKKNKETHEERVERPI